ncbi:MAG: hypothetical protein NXI17_05935 [Alphaproteobacteria bacterium]|nr:hypothetical protein [Alphaproteobacteria bacterium]
MTAPALHRLIEPLLWQAATAKGEVLKADTLTVRYTISKTPSGRFEAIWNTWFHVTNDTFGDIGGAIKACQEDYELRMKSGLNLESFQSRVNPWLHACFGSEIAANRIERNHRFLEEALELVQANGCTPDEAHQLVDYVFGRPIGVISQEVGGVMVTLAALCLASGPDMHEAGETELARVWTKIEAIRAKQAAKPKYSPGTAINSTTAKD